MESKKRNSLIENINILKIKIFYHINFFFRNNKAKLKKVTDVTSKRSEKKNHIR